MMIPIRLRLLIGLALYPLIAANRVMAAEPLLIADRTKAQSPVYFAPVPIFQSSQTAQAETPEDNTPLILPPVEPNAVEPDDATGHDEHTEDDPDQVDEAGPSTSSGGVVDIRQPDSTETDAEKALKASPEPSWLNDVIDENLALWRESTDVLEIIPNGTRGFGLTTLGFNSIWKSENAPGIWVVPRFGWTFASGPVTPAVQAQLYDLRLEMNLAQPINDVWTVHLQLAPAFVTDWNNKSKDAFRLIGGGMLTAHVSDELTLIGGALALSRFDLPVLPIGGVRWHPTPWMEVDALFPNPRLAMRYEVEGDKSEWLYVGGQLGGNQWAIDHATNDHDKLGYRDYRIVIGCETRTRDGNRSIFEVGYVFDRQLQFSSGVGDQQPGETFVIRWGSRF